MKHEFLGMSKEASNYKNNEGSHYNGIDGWHGQIMKDEFWG